jgi:hypothetical protein
MPWEDKYIAKVSVGRTYLGEEVGEGLGLGQLDLDTLVYVHDLKSQVGRAGGPAGLSGLGLLGLHVVVTSKGILHDIRLKLLKE